MKKALLLFLFPLLFFGCSEDDQAESESEIEEEFSSDLFISEYIEGSSFNKALEIVNLTGEIVDFEKTEYTIRKQTNGSGDWMSELRLTGSIMHTGVFVIANESADLPEITQNANQLKTGAPMDFNGNDPVGLFKEGVLIDIIGSIDNADDFAKDVSLRRKETITEPSATYDPDAWEVFETDNAENLGEY